MVKHTQELINKFRAKKNKASFAQSLIKKLDKLEDIEVDQLEKDGLLENTIVFFEFRICHVKGDMPLP